VKGYCYEKEIAFTILANSVNLFLVLGLICSVTYWGFTAPCSEKGYKPGSTNCSGYDFTGQACENKTTSPQDCFGFGYYRNPNAPTGNFSPGCAATGEKYENCVSEILKCGYAYSCVVVADQCRWTGNLVSYRGPDVGVDGGDCSSE